MEIILGIIVIAIIAYVLTKKKDVAEVNESTTAASDLRDLPAGTEAAVITGANTEAVYIAPEAVAPDAIVEAVVEAPVVTEEVAVEEAPAKKKRTRKAKE